MNPYDVLGVSFDADMSTIKKRFRELCLQYHPDRVEGKEKEFRDVISAFKMIENGWNPAISPIYQHERVSSTWYQPWDSGIESQPTTTEFWIWFRARSQHEQRRNIDWLELAPWGAFLILTLSLYILRPFG